MEVLFDLAPERSVELTQHDANLRIEIARLERDVQRDVVVVRQQHDRVGFDYAGAAQRLFVVGFSSHETRAATLDGLLEFDAVVLQHDDVLIRRRRQLRADALRQCVSSDDDHERLAMHRLSTFAGPPTLSQVHNEADFFVPLGVPQ